MSRIYIGRLPYQAREKEVERFFRGFGRIRDINLKNGFGFVELDDPRDAEDAVYELNGRELLGERVIVEHARGGGFRGGQGGRGDDGYRGFGRSHKYGPPIRTDYRINVENISSRVSWQDLKDFMRQAGEITYADAHKMRVGEGVVEYASYSDLKNALRKLDGAELNGRRIRLYEDSRSRRRSRSRSRSRERKRSWSRSRDRRSRSRSRSRSKSRDRSRSRSRSKDRSASRERSKERSRSRSRDASKERSADRENGDRRSRSRSRSEDRNERSRSRSKDSDRDRSRSPSPAKDGSPPREEEMQERSPSPAAAQHDE